MSGAEIAGLALAVLPIVVSAARQYNNSLDPFSRYKRFAVEAERYYKELDIQRTRFRNQCRNLLEEVVDHDVASCMLNSTTHQDWKSQTLDRKLVQSLGESLSAYVEAIDLIQQRLYDITEESARFKDIVDHEKQSTPRNLRNKLWKRKIGDKVRFSLSKSRLDENIAKLRAYNDDLKVLAADTCHSVPRSKPSRVLVSWKARDQVQGYHTTAQVSCQVYEALRRACTRHIKHITYIRVEAELLYKNADKSPQVKFELAFTHGDSTDKQSKRDPVWLLVDSIIEEHLDICLGHNATCMEDLEKSLKRQLEPTNLPNPKKAKKSVRFASTSSSPPAIQRQQASAASPILNYLIAKDFCNQLRRHFLQLPQPNLCVVLEDRKDCRHLAYPKNRMDSAALDNARSLEQLIRLAGMPNSNPSVLLHERIALARRMAIAVLQYHNTPWLRSTWRSKDIIFFDTAGEKGVQGKPNLSRPFINAPIEEQVVQQPQLSSATLARNPLLFSLGVVLIEIAYTASFQSLKLPCDAGQGEIFSDFFAARRLAKSKRNVMGPVYNDIIEKLVECVFPHGGDLANLGLQAMFYEEVVSPLEELEQGFRKLCVGG